MTTIITDCPHWCSRHITGMAPDDPDYHRGQERTFDSCERNGWGVAAGLASYESDDFKEPTHIEVIIGDLLHGTVASIDRSAALALAAHLLDLVDTARRTDGARISPDLVAVTA